jgi:hypothetical protein
MDDKNIQKAEKKSFISIPIATILRKNDSIYIWEMKN